MFTLHLKNIKIFGRIFAKIVSLLWEVKKVQLAFIAILSIISGLFPAISIISLTVLINSIQSTDGTDFNYLLYPMLIYLGLKLAERIVFQINSYLQNLYKKELHYKVNLMIIQKANQLTLSHFENSEIYDKLRRAQNETIERPFIVFSIFLNILTQVFSFISLLLILVSWKPWVIILVILNAIISSLFMIRIGRLQYNMEYKRSPDKRRSWYFSYIMTNDIAFKEKKIYNLSSYFKQRYIEINRTFILQDKKIIKIRSLVSIVFELTDNVVSGWIWLTHKNFDF